MGLEFKWRHFAGEVILRCVRWYCRYGIICRDLKEMIGERNVAVDHTARDRPSGEPLVANRPVKKYRRGRKGCYLGDVGDSFPLRSWCCP
jgi:hypothetical protein